MNLTPYLRFNYIHELCIQNLSKMAALGNFRPFNASGNIHKIAILKRLLHTLSRHFGASDELLLTTRSGHFSMQKMYRINDINIYARYCR
jgi:hypothetical protein